MSGKPEGAVLKENEEYFLRDLYEMLTWDKMGAGIK